MDRKAALRVYMTEVVRDLMIRGAIRRQQGWTLEKILASDGRAVVNQIYADLAEAAGSVAGELLRGVGGMVEQKLGALVGSFADAIAGRKR